MFTHDELRAVPLFASLADKELDYLANTSADIRSVKRVAAGVGEGSMAIAFVHQCLQCEAESLASASL